MFAYFKNRPWPYNLWSTILQTEVSEGELPNDWEQALEYVLESLGTTKRKEIILYYYRDGMTLQKISDLYDVKIETTRQYAEKALRLMRHPTRKIYLEFGLENAQKALYMAAMETTQQKPGVETIASLNLSVRSYNGLRRVGIDTVTQLTQHTEQEISRIRNLGVKSLHEIKERLAEHGLSLRA